jgi:Peptidase propeptide and YPEB domain
VGTRVLTSWRRCLAGMVLTASVLAMPESGVMTPGSAQGLSTAAQQESWVCTAVPRRFWLPLGVLTERLIEQGFTVLDAVETRDDCYSLRLRGRDSRETTVIFDPVSAKPLR